MIDLKYLPTEPGCYIFKNNLDEIIYVGKAKNLKNRVKSYFIKNQQNSKTQVLVKNISKIDYIIVDTEIEALLLENKLIKKHKPKFNIDLKDDKTYPYIKITNDKFPKIVSTRIRKSDGEYFGPFTDSKLKNDLIKLIVEEFQILTNSTYRTKSNLNYQIKLAPAKKISEINKEEYFKNLNQAKEILKGNYKELFKKLKDEMKIASKIQEFEIALDKKQKQDILKKIEEQKIENQTNKNSDIVVITNDNETSLITVLGINKGILLSKKNYKFDYFDENLITDFLKLFYSKNSVPHEIILEQKIWNNENEKKLLETFFTNFRGSKVELIVPQKGDKKKLLELTIKNAKDNFGKNDILYKIKEKLNLKNLPKTIECFDISNLGDKFIVGAMTQFVNGFENKSGYRKFKIKTTKTQDDFKSIEEVITRRYKKLKEENEKFPDLIIIDGGLGQFEIAKKVLEKLELIDKIDLISIGKGSERKKNDIYTTNSKTPLIFDENEKFMLFIRRVRDSVHNFVINYNRSLRKLK